ncbi:MAG: (Fe-S)-binding protein [Candidatus Woesearchaeota archaeon]
MVFGRLNNILNTKRILYFPGCITRYASPNIVSNYRTILSDLNINFFMITELKCCGKPLLDAGYSKEFNEFVSSQKRVLEKNNVTCIISECPGCSLILNIYYEIDTMHVTELLDKKISRLSKINSGDIITYHDSCDMIKLGLINEPRRVLKKTGFEIDEFKENKQNMFCCGAGGLLRLNSPKLASNIAKERIKSKKKIVTCCPKCYIHLKENSEGKVYELSELIVKE